MKKIFGFLFTLILVVSCMVVPVFATDYVYPALPNQEGRQVFVVANSNGSFNAYILHDDAQQMAYVDESNNLVIELAYTYNCLPGRETWSAAGIGRRTANLNFYTVIYATHNVYDKAGNLVIPATVSDDATGAILPTVATGESLNGVLTEVLGMVVVTVPVVVGLFGIRKGIAFLIARIRGV